MLWTTAGHPGVPVDQKMLQHPDRHAIRSRRQRLSGLLEDWLDLDTLIVNVRGHGYQLNIAADDIILLQDNGLGQLQLLGRHSR